MSVGRHLDIRVNPLIRLGDCCVHFAQVGIYFLHFLITESELIAVAFSFSQCAGLGLAGFLTRRVQLPLGR